MKFPPLQTAYVSGLTFILTFILYINGTQNAILFPHDFLAAPHIVQVNQTRQQLRLIKIRTAALQIEPQLLQHFPYSRCAALHFSRYFPQQNSPAAHICHARRMQFYPYRENCRCLAFLYVIIWIYN